MVQDPRAANTVAHGVGRKSCKSASTTLTVPAPHRVPAPATPARWQQEVLLVPHVHVAQRTHLGGPHTGGTGHASADAVAGGGHVPKRHGQRVVVLLVVEGGGKGAWRQ